MSNSSGHPLSPPPPVSRAGAHAATVGARPDAAVRMRASVAAHDALSSGQRRWMVALIVAAHGAAAWGLLQVREVRATVASAAPIFVDLIAAPTSPSLSPPPPPPPPPTPVPKPALRTPPSVPVIATPAEPTATPPAFAVPAPPTEMPPPALLPAPVPAPADTVAVALAPPAPPAAPAPQAVPAPPKLIPAASVQYLEPPEPEFPRASRRLGESGRVLLRVFIDEAGLPRQVLVAQSSGFSRLDDAAVAAMKKARFRPYAENGQATAGWAPAPIDFELER